MFKTKRLLSLLLAIVMIASLSVMTISATVSEEPAAEGWNGTTTAAPTNGAGTADNPWQIETAENLAWLSAAVADTTIANAFAETTFESRKVFAGYYFVQTADIDLNNQKFTPIGQKNASAGADRIAFGGTYDGAGYKISNADISLSTTMPEYTGDSGWDNNFYRDTVNGANWTGLVTGGYYASGLFGVIHESATIKNVNACNIDVGTLDTTKSKSWEAYSSAISGVIVGSSIGYANILNCTTDAECSVYGMVAGGILGYSEQGVGNVKECVNNATVTGDLLTGGIVGAIDGTSKTSHISYCVNNGVVNGYGFTYWAGVGGILGGPTNRMAGFTNIEYCVNSAKADLNVTGTWARADGNQRVAIGGIVGYGVGYTSNSAVQKLAHIYNYNLADHFDITWTNTPDKNNIAACGGIAGYMADSAGNGTARETFENVWSVAGTTTENGTTNATYDWTKYRQNGNLSNAVVYTDTSKTALQGLFTGCMSRAQVDYAFFGNTSPAPETGLTTSHYGVDASEIEKDVIYKSIIEAADTVTNDVTYVGVQDSLIKGDTYSVRFIAGLSSTAYKAAGFKVTINGVTKTYTSADAYTTLTGITDTNDTKTYDAAAYGYEAFTALVIADIPTGSAITFEITPLVVKGDATYEGNTYTVEYDANGYFVSQCASQPQD